MKRFTHGEKVLVKSFKQLKLLNKISIEESKIYDYVAKSFIVEDMYKYCNTIVTITDFQVSATGRIEYFIEKRVDFVWDYRWLIPLRTPAAKILYGVKDE